MEVTQRPSENAWDHPAIVRKRQRMEGDGYQFPRFLRDLGDMEELDIEINAHDARLINYLQSAIGSSDSCLFSNMKQMLKAYMPPAEVETIRDMRAMLNKMKTTGYIKAGDYDFLINNIFKPSGYADQRTLDKIKRTEEGILSLKDIQKKCRETTVSSPEEYNQLKQDLKADLVSFYKEDSTLDIDVCKFWARMDVTRFLCLRFPLSGIGFGSKKNYISADSDQSRSITELWCEVNDQVDDQTKKQNKNNETGEHKLKKYDFVFRLSMKGIESVQNGVDEMIKRQIVSQLPQHDKYTDAFLQELLHREKCLIILENADDWFNKTDKQEKTEKVLL